MHLIRIMHFAKGVMHITKAVLIQKAELRIRIVGFDRIGQSECLVFI